MHKALLVCALATGCETAPPATTSIAPASLPVTPQYLEAPSAWLPAHRVCLDASLPQSARDRAAERVRGAGLAQVAVGTDCDWQLAGGMPTLVGPAAQAWSDAGTHVERHVFSTTLAGSTMTTTLYAADARGARYAVDAAFEQLVPSTSLATVNVPATILVDWPAFPVRGVVEGFYGPPFAADDRGALLDAMSTTRHNTYVYGPQNDPYAHGDWFELYPDAQLQAFAEAVRDASAAEIDFAWAVRPSQGVFYPGPQPIVLSSDADFATLMAKLDQLRSVGVTHFGLFFDDTVDQLAPADQRMFGSLVEGQIYLVNRVDAALRARDSNARLWMVGTAYSTVTDGWQGYNDALRAGLSSTVDLMWTGDKTYSPTIDAADLSPVEVSMGRQPFIWDNWPQEVTALYGRAIDVPDVAAGFFSNPVICSWQHATVSSFIDILGTAGMYAWRPSAYDVTTALATWRAIEGKPSR